MWVVKEMCLGVYFIQPTYPYFEKWHVKQTANIVFIAIFLGTAHAHQLVAIAMHFAQLRRICPPADAHVRCPGIQLPSLWPVVKMINIKRTMYF
jgi:hypothetical protein